jgi:ATP-dependent Clp protease ATP-binding subunit ClpA
MFPFDRFTDRAKKVLTLAQQEAEAAGHAYIGTEHLLLGLILEGEGLAAVVLGSLGVELDRTREAIRAELSGSVRHVVSQIIPTSRVKKVIETAFEEARRLDTPYVGTEHLLLGLLVEQENLGATVLRAQGVTLEKVRAEADRLRESGFTEETAPPQTARLGIPAMLPDLQQLLARAQAQAGGGERTAFGLDHLLAAIVSTAAGIEVLVRLLDARRLAAQKEQAIAAQDYEAAARHRTDERRAREALEHALSEWRAELEPPTAAEASSS